MISVCLVAIHSEKVYIIIRIKKTIWDHLTFVNCRLFISWLRKQFLYWWLCQHCWQREREKDICNFIRNFSRVCLYLKRDFRCSGSERAVGITAFTMQIPTIFHIRQLNICSLMAYYLFTDWEYERKKSTVVSLVSGWERE